MLLRHLLSLRETRPAPGRGDFIRVLEGNTCKFRYEKFKKIGLFTEMVQTLLSLHQRPRRTCYLAPCTDLLPAPLYGPATCSATCCRCTCKFRYEKFKKIGLFTEMVQTLLTLHQRPRGPATCHNRPPAPLYGPATCPPVRTGYLPPSTGLPLHQDPTPVFCRHPSLLR
ncbi:hypothetical protein D623_10002569 [Myotis brandtii]|uniref:Uncharacterized protein n=1 Tax=Myotis brandtii TaxID=109478 RepID=S7MJP0_MYOBR|nr:hypothetical protein D623_10002569 [Myotis brandtii]